jgi:hypothetical protein
MEEAAIQTIDSADLVAEQPVRRRLPLVLDPGRMSADERIEMLRTRLEYAPELAAAERDRPRTRAECERVPRPCPYVSCRWNLYLDVDEAGRIVIPDADTPIEERRYSCALDVIEDNPDGVELTELAAITGFTREQLARIEEHGRARIGADEQLAEDHDRESEEDTRRVRRLRPVRTSPVAGGDLRSRLSAALRERAILDVLSRGPKTTPEIVAALAGSEQETSAWNVRHVLRVLRARELVNVRNVPVGGQDAPVMEWRRVSGQGA